VAANLVLHVVDGSHPQYTEQREVGDQVLADLGVDRERIVEVYNKVDRIDEHFAMRRPNSVVVSALTGEHIERLVEMIRDHERAGGELLHLEIPHAEARTLAKLHELAEVQEQATNDAGAVVTAWVPRDSVHLFSEFVTRSSRRRAAV
jgi:GTP-binding protein HflX